MRDVCVCGGGEEGQTFRADTNGVEGEDVVNVNMCTLCAGGGGEERREGKVHNLQTDSYSRVKHESTTSMSSSMRPIPRLSALAPLWLTCHTLTALGVLAC